MGVGSAAAFVICVVGGVLFYRRRRKTNRDDAHELETVPALFHDDDRKELYRHHATQELPTRHPPAELSAVELAELQGSSVEDSRVK